MVPTVTPAAVVEEQQTGSGGDEPAIPQIEGGLDLRARLDRLHETLYARGGIRPVNAAIEELSKILLLQIKNAREPAWRPEGTRSIAAILDPERLRNERDAADVKAAFSAAIRLPEFSASLPDGSLQAIWPHDEPFRLTRGDVLAEAVALIDPALLRRVEASDSYDLLGTAFDAMLRGRYDHSGGLATYLTPHNVADLLARLCLCDLEVPDAWRPGAPLFGDMCCGTGRFLVAGVREVRRIAHERYSDDRAAQRFIDAYGATGVVGADQSSSSIAKARLNLILFGIESPRVFTTRDAISDRLLDRWRGRMHLILTNPPFGDGKYDEPTGVLRTTSVLRGLRKRKTVDPALAFLVRCLDLLDAEGRLGIVLPDGLIDGAALRGALLGSDTTTRLRDVSLEANVSLPTAAFALSGTVARTSAVVIRKGGSSRVGVLLARAAHCGYLKHGNRAVADPHGDDLPTIAEIGVRSWSRLAEPEFKQGVNTLCEKPAVSLVDRRGLISADPSRFDPLALMARRELLDAGGTHLADHLHPVARTSAAADGHRPFVSVLHVDDLGVICWPSAYTHMPTTPGRLARSGQLLVSMLNPGKLRATVIPDDEPEIICSSEFGVFDADDPWAVLILLNDSRVRAQLAPLGRGTSSSRRRIDTAEFLSLALPVLDERVVRRGAAVRAAHGTLRAAALAAAEALASRPVASQDRVQ